MSSITATWKKLASSTRLQRSSQCLSTIGSQIFIYGGELQPRQPVDNQLDIIDASSNSKAVVDTIAPSGTAPSPRVGTASTVLNGKLYLFSGRGGTAMTPIEEDGALWSYDPSAKSWSTVSPSTSSDPVPAARSYHASTNDGSSKIYLHAGCPEKGRLADLWSFDINEKKWASLAAAPDPPRGGTSIAFVKATGKLYRMNGFDGTKEQGGAVDIYDPSSDTWKTVYFEADGNNGPEARSVGALLNANIQGKEKLVTLFGEHDPSSLGHAGAGKMLADIWAFDLGSEKWTKVEAKTAETGSDGPASRGWFDADVLKANGQDTIVVHGGLAEDNSRLGDVWVLEFV